VFSIEFDPTLDTDDVVADGQTVGVIWLSDDYYETFESCLCVWTRADYERQWRAAIEQVLDGEASGLLTAYHDPPMTNFMRWWPMYPIDANVRFQEHMLFMDDIGEPFDLGHLNRYALPYESETEDGQRVSEWAVPREDLVAFLSS
jgi:hypothetical protein